MSDSFILVRIQRFLDRPHLGLQWTCPLTGRRLTQTTGTADWALAERKRQELERKLNDEAGYKPPPASGWSDFRRAFELEYLSGRAPNTRLGYKATLDLFEELVAPRKVELVTARTLSQFVGLMRALPAPRRAGMRAYKASTIALARERLSCLLHWAVQQNYLDRVPAMPDCPRPRKLPEAVDCDALERFLLSIEDLQLRVYCLVGWLSALRRNEIYYLSWERGQGLLPWLDLPGERIILPAEFVKGRRDEQAGMPPALVQILQAMPRREGDPRVFRFVGELGREVTPTRVGEWLTELSREAGLERFSIRVLRRAFGTHAAGLVPAQVLQRLMRHKDIRITMDFYANVDEPARAFYRQDTRCSALLGAPSCTGGSGAAQVPGGEGIRE